MPGSDATRRGCALLVALLAVVLVGPARGSPVVAAVATPPEARAATTAEERVRVEGARLAAVPQETRQVASPGLQALETFDAAWEIVRDTHYDPELNGVDWEAVRREFRPLAAAAEETGELRDVIEAMLARLGESHFRLWPGDVVDALERARSAGDDASDPGQGGAAPGLEVGWVEGRALVTEVEGSAAEAGVRPGWELVAVGEQALAEPLGLLRERVQGRELALEVARLARGMLGGQTGSTATVHFRDGRGEPREVTLARRRPRGRLMKFGNLPPMLARFDDRRLELGPGLEAGLIRFNVWLPLLAPQLDRAVERLRDVDGMVVDLRGNPGGVGGMVMGFSGHFLDESVTLGTMRTRDGELRYVSNPRTVDGGGARVEPFDGPLAVIVDATTGSTSEVFAGGMQALGRARIFGHRTVGAVLPSLMDRLPNGDVLQHAFADFVTAAGERLEGRGVEPDEVVPVTREGLLEGRDAPLEAALRWIEESQRTPGTGDAGPVERFNEEGR